MCITGAQVGRGAVGLDLVAMCITESSGWQRCCRLGSSGHVHNGELRLAEVTVGWDLVAMCITGSLGWQR
jgi:hypothetical protein